MSDSFKERISTAQVWREGEVEYWRRDELSPVVVAECLVCGEQAYGMCVGNRDSGGQRALAKLVHDNNCALMRATDHAARPRRYTLGDYKFRTEPAGADATDTRVRCWCRHCDADTWLVWRWQRGLTSNIAKQVAKNVPHTGDCALLVAADRAAL